MKKSILLIATALFLFAGNQSVTAQAKMEKQEKTDKIELHAEKKMESLVHHLDLNEKQKMQVYNLLVENEKKMNKSIQGADVKKKEAIKARLNDSVKSSLKEILNEDQYKKFLILSEKEL